MKEIKDYKNNSLKGREKEKEIKSVIKGTAKIQKPTLVQKIKEIVGDDGKSVMEYIIYDVIIPAAKDMISDTIGGGINMILFGTRSKRTNSFTRDKERSYVNYNLREYGKYSEPNRNPNRRVRVAYNDVVLTTRDEAELVLDTLTELTSQYEVASVADLYGLVNLPSTFQDNKFGWTDLSEASVKRIREGYLIDLPKPEVID